MKQTLKSRQEKLRLQREKSREASRRSVRFLDSRFLLPPGPSLLLAHTGKGKTTCMASQAYHALRTTKGLIICALNEETEPDFYARIACMDLNMSFSEYKSLEMSQDMIDVVDSSSEKLMDRVRVIDQDLYNLNSLEDMLRVVRQSCFSPLVSIVLVDYLQNITETRDEDKQDWARWDISKHFGEKLKEYGKTALCPILIAAQVNPGDGDAVSRVQSDRTFGNHAKAIIELKTDFDNQETEAKIEKDRFNSCTGKSYIFKYRLGLLSFFSEKNTYEAEDE